jgi:uncharacterized repeat protein (TIGR03803 family)
MTNTRQQGISGIRLGAAALTFVVLGLGAATPQSRQTLTVLHSFTRGSDGENPYAGLVRDGEGNLYGTTLYGGSYGYGTVFKVDENGTEKVLHSFAGGTSDGSNPYAGVISDTDGDVLFGTTAGGVSSGRGTVFKVDTSGKETVLHVFTGSPDGAYPLGGLTRDQEGNLYGTTNSGGSYGYGTVFKVDPGGTETVLYSFTGSPDGAYPILTSLLIDKNDTLYGVTNNGGGSVCGGNGCGTLYKLTKSGKETVLYSFSGGTTDGCYPYGTLAMDTKYNLYGTTNACGSSGLGIVWKVETLVGTESVLHSFAGADGNDPEGVIMDTKGNLYGETVYGGDLSCNSGCGTLYKLSKSGTLTVLHIFHGSDGPQRPQGGLIRDAKGILYGTTYVGGSDRCDGLGCGTVWKLTP